MREINIFCFGLGQVAKNFISKIKSENYKINLSSTSTSKTSKKNIKEVSYVSYFFNSQSYDDNLIKKLKLGKTPQSGPKRQLEPNPHARLPSEVDSNLGPQMWKAGKYGVRFGDPQPKTVSDVITKTVTELTTRLSFTLVCTKHKTFFTSLADVHTNTDTKHESTLKSGRHNYTNLVLFTVFTKCARICLSLHSDNKK